MDTTELIQASAQIAGGIVAARADGALSRKQIEEIARLAVELARAIEAEARAAEG